MGASVDVSHNISFIFSTLYHIRYRWIFRSQYHEGRSVDGVDTCGEYSQCFVIVLDLELGLGAVRFADPVSLHDLDLVGPSLKLVQIVQKPLSVIGDLEIPL